MMKPSRHSSVASAFFRATPLRLALPALALVAAFGLFVSGCGDDSPTTPTPAPTPTPTPPTPPAPPEVPTGLAVASVGPDYIEWTWTAVEDAASYDIQMTTTENDFSESQLRNIVAPATSARFTVAAETQAWARVRAKTADAESDYSAAVPGTSDKMPLVLSRPTGFEVADKGPRFIEWEWNVVEGATAYEVQVRLNDANFVAADRIRPVPATAAPKYRHTVEPETTAFARVRAVAGTGADRVEGDWALAVEGESDKLPLGVPTGLEVSATGQDFIEATWDAVEGATGYTVQLDIQPPYNFSPSSRQAEATTTSHRFTGLASGRTAHVRVRATRTRGSDRDEEGEYSDPVVTATEEPPVVPIGTPTGLTATSPTRSQVSLNWADVTNAETYLVQQRVGSSGNWVNATCDESDDNEVDESECTATGLESGTEYQFRVRAVPVDNDDDLLDPSDWSSATSATTTGRATTGTGGAGELNITWRSTQNSITWRWDQAGRDVDFQMDVLEGVLDLEAPCEDRTVDWEAGDFSNSHTEGGLSASDARLLCVRTVTTDNTGKATYGDPSWSWAAAAPTTPGSPVAMYEDGATGGLAGETETLSWSASFSNLPQFEYDIHYIVDETEKDNDDWEAPTGSTATLREAAEQRACSAADVTEEINPSGSAGGTFTSSIDLEPYAVYRMCYRAVNEDGASNWAYDFAAPIYTRPIRPAIGTGSPSRNHNSVGETGNTHFRIQWVITTNANAPRIDTSDSEIMADYTFRIAKSTRERTETEVRDVCQDPTTAGANAFNVTTAGNDHIRQPTRATTSLTLWFTYLNGDLAIRSYHYLCARTNDVRSGTGAGTSPWVISPAVPFGGSN